MSPKYTYAHPLSPLNIDETELAANVIRSLHPNTVLQFRIIYLREPDKEDLIKFLDVEHSGQLLPDTQRPPRLATVHYVAVTDKVPQSIEAIVDLGKRERVWQKIVETNVHPSFTLYVVSLSQNFQTLSSYQDPANLPITDMSSRRL